MASRLIAKNLKMRCIRAWMIVPRRHQTFGPVATAQTDNKFVRVSSAELTPKVKKPIAGQKYNPGAQDGGFPEFLAPPKYDFPYALTPSSPDRYTIEEWAEICQDQIESRLLTNGALLFRGLPLSETKHFSRFTRALKYTPQPYLGHGLRDSTDEDEFISRNAGEPPRQTIELHSEMAYSAAYPMKVLFYCLREPLENCGGLTPIASSREILSKLDPDIVTKFEQKGILYSRYLPSQSNATVYSWQQACHTDDPKEVERSLEKSGIEYKWYTDTDALFCWYTLPATHTHPQTGEKVWFNQITSHHSSCTKDFEEYEGLNMPGYMYPYHTAYGDGSEIEPEVIQHIRVTSWQCAVGFQWKNGDLLVLDNMLALHARLGYTGARKILSCVISD